MCVYTICGSALNNIAKHNEDKVMAIMGLFPVGEAKKTILADLIMKRAPETLVKEYQEFDSI